MELLYVLIFSIVFALVRLALCGGLPNLRRAIAAALRRLGAPPETISLKISAEMRIVSLPPSPDWLCECCVFSHIVRGREPLERMALCGYAFPLRELPFVVRECSDFKAKRTQDPIGKIPDRTLNSEADEAMAVGFRVSMGLKNSLRIAKMSED